MIDFFIDHKIIFYVSAINFTFEDEDNRLHLQQTVHLITTNSTHLKGLEHIERLNELTTGVDTHERKRGRNSKISTM